jgi:hypothetical protein
VNTVFISSSNELGEFESGATAAWWGPVRSVVVGGLGTIAVVLVVLARWPGLLKLPPLHVLAPHPPVPSPRAHGESEIEPEGRGGGLPPRETGIVSADGVTGVRESSRDVRPEA